ncbi:hypothetical protein R7P37_14435 [Vibrio sp. 431]|uniref:hypothetical protein n=1 Tax=Vibrio TaxID=662 RepID=UPI002964B685|nr:MULTISPECIES: hypothetical protein [unclassified Vibrio]MDW1964771.1 hypothetical protein [Vibrio sp. Vb0587]MDW2006638.1 hypothetical protein [Vibrio sp. 431]
MTMPFFLYGFFSARKYIVEQYAAKVSIMVFISIYAVYVSYVYEMLQFNHIRVTTNILIYLIFSVGVSVLVTKMKMSINDIFKYVFFVLVINSIVVLLQVTFPVFRTVIEFFLLPSGNVDWSDGFRYRGIASGGGAALSILIPVALSLGLYLLKEKEIRWYTLMAASLVLTVSLFFIGRTGIALIPIVLTIYLLFSGAKNLLRALIIISISLIMFVSLFEHIKDFVISVYGEAFFKYAFGFFLDGKQGIEDEGTVGVLIDFVSVVPYTFPEVLTGVGFYGSGDFYPWTDSGYARMFLSVGFFFGGLYYIAYFMLFRKTFKLIPFLSVSVALILAISEVKEGLMVSGYAARVFILIMVMYEYMVRAPIVNMKVEKGRNESII